MPTPAAGVSTAIAFPEGASNLSQAATDEVNLARESLSATGATVPAAPSPAPDR